MKYLIAFLLAALLIFGCVGGPSTPSQSNTNQGTPSIPGVGQPAAQCTPSQTFSDLPNAVLSSTTQLTATVTCYDGSSIVVKVDGQPVVTQAVTGNATQAVQLGIPATTDGAHNVSVEIGGQSLLSKAWTVAPLGNPDVKGLETDAVSFKEWRAEAVDVQNPITAARVKAYLSTQQSTTEPNSHIVMEIEKDNGGNPGDVVATVKQPIKVVTQSDNWINFDLDPAVTLQPGRYWIVFSVEQTQDVNLVSDLVQLHYVTVDKTASGNDHTTQMLLNVDPKSGMASESQWTPLSYNREYNIVLTTSK